MSRRLSLAVFVLAVLAAAPAARASGPMPAAVMGGPGVLSPDETIRYTTVAASGSTVLTAVGTANGALRRTLELPGLYGMPQIAYGATAPEGLSHDGRTLVLPSVDQGGTSTSFLIVDTRKMRVRASFTLKGRYAYDAVSPDGRTLYLIEYASVDDLAHYVVRAYDTLAGRLLPGRIADRTQKTWVMQGFPLTRTAGADGRWVYTLYSNPGGYPFVHALDTVAGVAHCVGLPWHGSDADLSSLVLTLRGGGGALAVQRRGGPAWVSISTASWRISYAGAGAGFPWSWAGPALAGGLALLAAAALLLRRRLRQEAQKRPGQELGLA